MMEKLVLTFSPDPKGVIWVLMGGGVGWDEICGQNICYHVAVFMIPFTLICNITTW